VIRVPLQIDLAIEKNGAVLCLKPGFGDGIHAGSGCSRWPHVMREHRTRVYHHDMEQMPATRWHLARMSGETSR
jgi:hypothetical protein